MNDPAVTLSRRTFLAAVSAPLTVPVRPEIDPAIRDLERRGRVNYVFTDAGRTRDKNARTTFNLTWTFGTDFRHGFNKRAGVLEVLIAPQIMQVDVSLAHTISLPARYVSFDFRRDALVRHELDHVAISLDGRPQLILRYLLEHLPEIRRPVTGDAPPHPAWLRRLVKEEVDRRGNAVVKLIQANYDLLDSRPVSDHGRQALGSRAAFFAGLYTEANLTANRFEFRADVAPLLTRKDYREVRPVFVN